VATKANEAKEADFTNEAAYATEVTEAEEADLANKADLVDEAADATEATEADKADFLREMASKDCVLSLGSSDPTTELSRWRVMTHAILESRRADRE
jgi:hypothetical protein